MRADMAKVIVERPRLAGGAWKKPKGYQRRLHRLRDEGSPVREGMKARWQGGTKWLNEHLGPLRRYLDSQVGRPWNDVFSEICQHINRNSAVQDHVRDHVEDYVAVHVLLIDSVPCSGEGGRGYGQPLHQIRWKRWYVCPRTGILRRIKVLARPPKRTPPRLEPPRYIRVSDTLQCRRINGAWYLITLKPLPLVPGQSQARDVFLDRPVAELDPTSAVRHYGVAAYATAQRRLARRELSQFPIPVDAWE